MRRPRLGAAVVDVRGRTTEAAVRNQRPRRPHPRPRPRRREEEGKGRGVDEDDDDESGVNRMFEFGVAQVSGSFDVKRDVFRGARGRWGGGGVMRGLHSAGKKDGKKE